MTSSYNLLRAPFGFLVILSAVSSIALMSNTFAESASAASKNFAATCEGLTGGGSVKALAVEPAYSNQQICACAQTNEKLRKQLGAAGIKCNADTLTNLNQVVTPPTDTTQPPTPPGPEPALNGNNGWGNGGEGINNGSDNGTAAQSDTKSADKNGQGQR
jgi:hypothetical protein